MNDTWYSRAVPILQAIAEVEGSDDLITIGELTDRTGVDPAAVVVEVERLIGAGYIAGRLAKMATGGDMRPWFISSVRLGPEGARVVGLWPSRDPYEALVAVLERRIVEEPDEPTRSRLRKVRDTITGLGREVGSNLIASVLVEVGRRGF